MDLSPFISSDPATRRDGWSPERKARFLDRLAACGNVRVACAGARMSREAAYTLRRRDPMFARGWAAALVLARESSIEVLADKATEGIEEEVWYRGELVGTRRRFDARLLLAHVTRLDRMVEESESGAVEDAARFDVILACIAGVGVPEELQAEGDPLPLDRESTVAETEHEVRAAINEVWAEREAENEDKLLSDEEYEEHLDELEAGAARARAEARVQWDGWFERACRTVDDLLGYDSPPPLPGLPGNPLPAPASTAENAGEQGPALSFPRTLSDVSVSALAQALAGPAQGFATPPRSPFQAPRSG